MLPSIHVSQLDEKKLRATVAIAINTHLHGAATIEELANWALKFFHAMNQQVDDTDDDLEPKIIDADLVTILDELMFADHPNLAPAPETMRQWATQLMR
ncbi:MAG: hypothetical protein ACO3F2_05925 [Roseiflexaceae bacterium]